MAAKKQKRQTAAQREKQWSDHCKKLEDEIIKLRAENKVQGDSLRKNTAAFKESQEARSQYRKWLEAIRQTIGKFEPEAEYKDIEMMPAFVAAVVDAYTGAKIEREGRTKEIHALEDQVHRQETQHNHRCEELVARVRALGGLLESAGAAAALILKQEDPWHDDRGGGVATGGSGHGISAERFPPWGRGSLV